MLTGLALALGLLGPVPFEGETLRVVVREVSPALPKTHFRRQPKTIFRVGTCCIRVEEEPNPETGLHIRLIVHEPDVWFLNLAEMKADHIVDSGPTYTAHAPIVPVDGLEGLEFGSELSFMERHQARPSEAFTCRVGACRRRQIVAQGHTVTLVTAVPDERPVQISVQPPDGGATAFEYDAYEKGLDLAPQLFQLPGAVEVRERK